jgi:hypothetical protein
MQALLAARGFDPRYIVVQDHIVAAKQAAWINGHDLQYDFASI